MNISNLRNAVSFNTSDILHIANSSVSRWSGMILATSATALVGLGLYRWTHPSTPATPSSVQKDNFSKVKERVSQTYGYVFGGYVMTAAAAAATHISGLSLKILLSSYAGWGLAFCSCAALIATHFIDKENNKAQHLAWAIFNVTMGMALSPLGFLDPKIIAQAAAVSLGLGGALTLTAFLAPDKSFLAWEGPLMATLTSLSIASSIAYFFPGSAFAYGADRASLYGGLMIFSGLLMSSTQRLIEKAEKQSNKDFDPLKSSINLYLDGMNIFLRILRCMLENQKEEKKA